MPEGRVQHGGLDIAPMGRPHRRTPREGDRHGARIADPRRRGPEVDHGDGRDALALDGTLDQSAGLMADGSDGDV